MGKTSIRINGLSKLYYISQREHYKTLRDTLVHAVYAPFRRLSSAEARPLSDAKQQLTMGDQYVWALKDVSFEIGQGEVLGIIGANGAGKTTLLKILSRITEPTEGSAEIHGRVGSLLEIGTGFHPELTGRENIYLNAAILGMRRADIDRKLDEIVAFSGVERFIDTPVKRYSSGMHVRLAFGVAAHLEPDILVVDEVLAVGDIEFQKKCVGKMQDIAGGGRTVLFVSHSMTAISSLCSRVILLEQGKILFDGDVSAGIARYMANVTQAPTVDLSDVKVRRGPGQYGRIDWLSVYDKAGQPRDTFAMGATMVVRLGIQCIQRITLPEIGIALTNQMGLTLHLFVSTWEGLDGDLSEGRHTFEVEIPQLFLYPGRYILTPWLKRQGTAVDDQVDNVLMIEVIGADITGYGPYFERYRHSGCEVYVPSVWRRL